MMNDNVRHVIDGASFAAVIATIAGWLPPIAALMSIVWLGIQMVDRWRYGPASRRKPK